MSKIIKNIKISVDVMGLKQMIITILIVVISVGLINIFAAEVASEPINFNNMGTASVLNVISIIMFFILILLQVNTYRGLPLLQSFSVGKEDRSSYYVTTILFYSLIMYVLYSIFVAIPFYNFFDLSNKFAFGYYLEGLSVMNYLKITIMVYSIVLIVNALLQLFTLVGLRFGGWINIGLMVVTFSIITAFLKPLIIAITSGVDRLIVFSMLYFISIVIFIVCYYLQRGLEVIK